jgi:GH15 family glucan-1,4-alpha-glucosidase
VRIVYSVGEERWLPEQKVHTLAGYENSSFVRTGNTAYQHLQIDVLAEVVAAMTLARKGGTEITARSRALRPLVFDYLATAWREPDHGIWEARGERQHFVHSKAMAWVAFDRAAVDPDAQAFHDSGSGEAQLLMRFMPKSVSAGLTATSNSFVQAYGSKRLDASPLLMPLVGFLPATQSVRARNPPRDRAQVACRWRTRSAL